MIRPNVKLESYTYQISDVILTSDKLDESITIKNSFIRNISINNDYDNNVTPSISLLANIKFNVYNDIVGYLSDMYATFSISKTNIGVLNRDTTDEKNSDISQLDDVITVTLKIANQYNMNTSETYYSGPDNSQTNDKSDRYKSIEVFLYDSKKIAKYKIGKSYIISGSSNDLLYLFFSDRSMNKILMSSGEFTGSKEYVIPYGHLGDNLKYLNDSFGLYRAPYLFYMDLGRTYLLDKSKISKTREKGEFESVNIYLEQPETVGYADTGCYIDNESGLYILNANSFDINDKDSLIDFSFGGKLRTIQTGQRDVNDEIIGDYDVERTYVVPNEYAHEQIKYQIKESRRDIVLSFSNIDTNIITPNKLYSIIPDPVYYDKKYDIGGSYRLAKSVIIYTKASDDEWQSLVTVFLNKIIK